MAKTSVEMREERATIIGAARAIQDKAEAEGRDLSSEEQQAFDQHMTGVDALKVRIDRIEHLERAEGDLDAPLDRSGRSIDPGETAARQAAGWDGAELREAIYRNLRTGETDEILRSARPHLAQQRKAFRRFLVRGSVDECLRAGQSKMVEYRDTIIGTDSKGGYLIAPVQVTEALVKQIDDLVFMRQLATIQRVTEAKALGIRKLKTRMADADWTTEVGSVSEDSTQAFDRRDLTPSLLSKLSLLSIRTLLLSADVEALIREELSYKFGITEEKAYLTGDGTNKPLGIFTANANGISTGRDVVTATQAVLVGDDLINAKFSLKQNYLADAKARWFLHRNILKIIRTLKISTGGTAGDKQYVWQPGLTEGSPDRILDVPYCLSEYAPSTSVAGDYVAVLGNFRYYWIAEVIDLVIQRLVERYADTNQVGFIGRRWVDGAPILEEAFVRVQLHT